jgi:hypothetical protein
MSRAEQTERFGPFLNVPSADIQRSGFDCHGCGKPVRRLRKVVPFLVARIVFYSCQCGTVVVWEDERQPKDAQHWAQNIRLLKKAHVEVIVFNGNKETPPGFSGIN